MFQTALSVEYSEARQEPNEQVKATASELEEPRLVDSDQVPLEGARADGRVGTGGNERGNQLVGLFDGGGEIGVRKKDELAVRFEHAAAHAVALAAVRLVPENLDGPVTHRRLLEQAGRAVARAVVHRDEFDRKWPGLNELINPLERSANPLGLVVRGNNDAQERLGHRRQL